MYTSCLCELFTPPGENDHDRFVPAARHICVTKKQYCIYNPNSRFYLDFAVLRQQDCIPWWRRNSHIQIWCSSLRVHIFATTWWRRYLSPILRPLELLPVHTEMQFSKDRCVHNMHKIQVHLYQALVHCVVEGPFQECMCSSYTQLLLEGSSFPVWK